MIRCWDCAVVRACVAPPEGRPRGGALTQLPRGGLVQDDVGQAVAGRRRHQVAHGPPQGHAQVPRRRAQDGHGELVRHVGDIVSVDLQERVDVPMHVPISDIYIYCIYLYMCMCVCLCV